MVWPWRGRRERKSTGSVRSRLLPIRDRGAAVALEMAIVGPPFLLLMVFLTEITYDFYAQEALNYGVASAARCIQVGAAQGTTSAADFQANYLCRAIGSLINCNNVTVNIVPIPSGDNFQNYGSLGLPKNAKGQLDTSGFQFQLGSANSLMLVEAVYTSPSIVAGFVPGMAVPTGSQFVHATTSSAAFINENFPSSATPSTTC